MVTHQHNTIEATHQPLQRNSLTTSDSSESGGVPLPATEEWREQDRAMEVSGFETISVFSSSDSSTSSGESDVSNGMRSPRQSGSLPELLSEQPELDEAGSGYEADSSDNEDNSLISSVSDNADSSDSDSEARLISSRVTAAAWREYHERLNVLRANRLAELGRAIDHARHSLRTTVSHSFGEYMSSVASLEVLEREREREQLRLGVLYTRYQVIAGIALPVQPGAHLSHWPAVTCDVGKEYCLAITTSKHCEVHRITTTTNSCKKHLEVYRITTAGKPVVTTSCRTWT
ncbi:hypothetical protein MBLNU13_g10492t1 [Cladosporium sp. NU13]